MKIDFAAIPETKKKLKGSKYIEDYMMLYSGASRNERASKGIALYIHKKWEDRLTNYEFVSDRIITARIRLERGNATIIGVYAPEEGRREDNQSFYQTLQTVINKFNSTDQVFLTGDFNARVGNVPIDGCVGTFGEAVCNENGRTLRDFVTFNKLKITNGFFRKKDIHKYTWAARGYRSIIDYVMINKKVAGSVRDTRVYRGADICSDHFLVVATVDLYTKWKKMKPLNTRTTDKQVYKVHLLNEDSIRLLYIQRLNKLLETLPTDENIEEEWKKLEGAVSKVGNEVLGRKKIRKSRRGLRIWNQEIEDAINEKQRAYLNKINHPSEINDEIYRQKRNYCKQITRTAHEESWDRFISTIEADIHGRQNIAYKVMRSMNSEEKDRLMINNIKKEEWIEHYRRLWQTDETEETILETENTRGLGLDDLTMDEMTEALKTIKNRKATGINGVNAEMWKYGGTMLHLRLLHLFNMCWKTGQVPKAWNEAKVISLFKKGNKNDCGNYRGISLIDTAYKIYAKILNNRIKTIMEHLIGEEQMGFRKGRSTIDGVFTLQQIMEKHREYNRETHIAFIDFEKAFDNVNRGKLWDIMTDAGYPTHLIRAIQSLYVNTNVVLDLNGNLTDNIPTNKGVRQGCCLSPTLFNIYINKIIQNWKSRFNRGIQLDRNTLLNSILYADDLVLLVEREDDLQMGIHLLQQDCNKYDMKISVSKTKTMAFCGKYMIRTKITLNNKPLEQVNNFQYLGCNMSNTYNKDLEQKVNKFSRICGTISRTLKNKTRNDTQIKFYKTMAVPTITYGSEVWVTSKKQEQRIQTQEMKFLRRVKGCTRLDRIRNEDIRRELNVDSLNDLVKDLRKDWKEHVDRMELNRIPSKALRYRCQGKRDVGRPLKRWMP